MTIFNQKILLLLEAGVGFGYNYTLGQKWRALKKLSREWKKLEQEKVDAGIRSFYKYKIIYKKVNEDGSVNIELNEKGKFKALNIRLDNIKNKNKRWDKKWRMVAFDIPEKYKKSRDVVRNKLRKIGFVELQKSILIAPYDCQKELELFVKYYNLEKYVRFGIIEFIDNESYFKKVFKLG